MKENALFYSANRHLYEIGDLVVIAKDTEDGLLADYGYIKGIELDPLYARDKGWWYCIRIVAGEYDGIAEWVPENDIQGQVIHGKQNRNRKVCLKVRNRAIRALPPSNRLGLG